MHISQYERCISLAQALSKISANHSQAFQWYPVDNGKCKFDLGGTSKQIKAYVPNVIDGKLVVHQNDHVDSRYAIRFEEDEEGKGLFCVELSHANGAWKPMTKKQFVNFLKKDLTQVQVDIKVRKEIVCHEYADLVI